MKKLIIAVSLVVVFMVATTTLAWGGYIFQDPIFDVNGHEVSVMIGLDLPDGAEQDGVTQVIMYVPGNVEASLKDPLGCDVEIVQTDPQNGRMIRVPVLVNVPPTVDGDVYRVEVNVSDDLGFSRTHRGWAGQTIRVQYLQMQ